MCFLPPPVGRSRGRRNVTKSCWMKATGWTGKPPCVATSSFWCVKLIFVIAEARYLRDAGARLPGKSSRFFGCRLHDADIQR